eukprot:TRINITY_DN3296_c0_g1_i1.p1 TRINITY_DN3296_c0_g1~~TRINITY_DN3296_c0_g1_i1.p1  ORF type:complete len:1699 (-),score=536.14 TRINITY_DN3296_c0_g1_i1:50-5146(-)
MDDPFDPQGLFAKPPPQANSAPTTPPGGFTPAFSFASTPSYGVRTARPPNQGSDFASAFNTVPVAVSQPQPTPTLAPMPTFQNGSISFSSNNSVSSTYSSAPSNFAPSAASYTAPPANPPNPSAAPHIQPPPQSGTRSQNAQTRVPSQPGTQQSLQNTRGTRGAQSADKYNVNLDDLVKGPSTVGPTPAPPAKPQFLNQNQNVDSGKGKAMPSASSLSASALAMPSASNLPPQAPLASSNSGSGTADSTQSHFNKAAELIMGAFARLEKGVFAEALELVDQSTRELGQIRDLNSVKKEVKSCSNYKFLLSLLLEQKKPESNPGRAALLTRILADIPVQPKHRIVCVRMAINKNLEVRNYGTAGRFLKQLLSISSIPDAPAMQEKLKLCEDNKFVNQQRYAYTCPCCSTPGDCAIDECSTCNTKIQFCHKSFEPITQSAFHHCLLCDSVFSTSVTSPNQKCPSCSSSTLSVSAIPVIQVSKEAKEPPQVRKETKEPKVSSEAKPSDDQRKRSDSVPPKFGHKLPMAPMAPKSVPQLPSKSKDKDTTENGVSAPSDYESSENAENKPEQPKKEVPALPPKNKSKKQEAPTLKALPVLPSKPISRENSSEAASASPPRNVTSSFDEFMNAGAPLSAPKTTGPPALPKKSVEFAQNVVAKSQSLTDNEKTPAPAPPARNRSNTLPTPATFDDAMVPEFQSLNTITPSEMRAYANEFKKADLNGDGLIDGSEAKIYFSNAGTDKKNLAKIWRLADCDMDSKLDVDEFIIAMHLLSACLAGEIIPENLPPELIPTSKSRKKSHTISFVPTISDHSLEGPTLSRPPPPPSKDLPPPPPKNNSSVQEYPVPPSKDLPPPPPKDSGAPPPLPAKIGPTPTPPVRTLSRASSASSVSSVTSEHSASDEQNNTDGSKKGDKKKEEKEKKKQQKEEEKLRKKEEKEKAKTLRKEKKKKGDVEEPEEPEKAPGILSAPPTFSAPLPPTNTDTSHRPRAASSVAPPSLVTPPMLPNVITTEKPVPPPMLFTPPMLSNTMQKVVSPRGTITPEGSHNAPETDAPAPPRQRAMSVDSRPPPPPLPRDEPSLQDFVPPPIPAHIETPPPPQPTKPQARIITRQWEYYDIVEQGETPPEKDYYAALPAEIQLAVGFVDQMLRETDFNGCYRHFSSNLKQQVSLEQLTQLGEYYSRLDDLWYCQAISFTQPSHVLVYVPLYFAVGSYQAKMWITGKEIAGLEIAAIDEKWTDEGKKATYTIATPKVVVCLDGTRREVHSPKEEMDAMLDTNVPLGVQVGEETTFAVSLKQSINVKQKKPSLATKGRDGRTYLVFSEVSLNQATLRAHPKAYAREYWILEKEDPHCAFYLINKAGERLSEEMYVETTDGDLETLTAYKNTKKKDAKQLFRKPVPTLDHFYVLAMIPPEMHSQSAVVNSLRALPNGFLTTDRKAFAISLGPEEKKVLAEMNFSISTRSSKLTPRYEGSRFVKEAFPLTPEEKKDFTRPSFEIDYNDKIFHEYVVGKSLFVGIFGFKESPVQFAHRTYTTIIKEYDYAFPTPEIRLGELSKTRRGDEESLSRLFVAILRKNNIPARLLRGRFLKSKKAGKTIMVNGADTGVENQMIHCQAQFYVDEVGWIPVDVASFVRSKNPKFNENRPETFVGGFGADRGTFLALCNEDRPFVEVPVYGPRSDVHPVDFSVLFKYKKVENSDWKVTEQ